MHPDGTGLTSAVCDVVPERSPPAGATLIEPGVWEAPSGLYVDPATWAEWEREREEGNAAYAMREREAKDRRDRALLPEILQRNLDLQVSLYLRDVALAALVELWREAREQHCFAEELLAAVLAER